LGRMVRLTGTFGMDAPAWNSHAEPYVVHTSWSDQSARSAFQEGWRPPEAFSPVYAHPRYFLGELSPAKRSYPSPCLPGYIVQDVRIELPEGVTPVLPNPLARRLAGLSYAKEWFFEGRTLSVHTEITSSVKNHICSPEFMNTSLPAMLEVEQKDASSPVQFIHH
jgi:hypothetical protein